MKDISEIVWLHCALQQEIKEPMTDSFLNNFCQYRISSYWYESCNNQWNGWDTVETWREKTVGKNMLAAQTLSSGWHSLLSFRPLVGLCKLHPSRGKICGGLNWRPPARPQQKKKKSVFRSAPSIIETPLVGFFFCLFLHDIFLMCLSYLFLCFPNPSLSSVAP